MNKPPMPIDNAAMRKLEDFSFPGNVRELENMVERAIVIGNGKKIQLKDLPLTASLVDNQAESLDDHEKHHIHQILTKYDWNISRAAKALQVDRVTLYNKIRKYDLKPVETK